jgi:hypothetical protein
MINHRAQLIYPKHCKEIYPKYSGEMYRCDKFIKDHNKKHIVFIGDSFTAGTSLLMHDVWAYKVHKKIKEVEDVGGFYNLGMPAASISDCIDQFFKYCTSYSKPDVVFFLTTEPHRDMIYFNEDKNDFIIERLYHYLEEYCKSNNIQLYSFSWIKSIEHYKDSSVNSKIANLSKKIKSEWVGQSKAYEENILKKFKSFYDYSASEMLESVYQFDLITEKKDKSISAPDNVHTGTSFHDFYADFIYKKYLENNDNFRS